MSFIVPILIMLGFLATLIGLVVAIVLFVKAHGESDPMAKKSTHRKALWSFLGPLLFVIIVMTLWGLFQVTNMPHTLVTQ